MWISGKQLPPINTDIDERLIVEVSDTNGNVLFLGIGYCTIASDMLPFPEWYVSDGNGFVNADVNGYVVTRWKPFDDDKMDDKLKRKLDLYESQEELLKKHTGKDFKKILKQEIPYLT